MVVYARSEANRKVQTDKPSNQNLRRKLRGTAELETGGRQLRVAPVTRNSGAENGIAGRLKYRNRKGSMETGGAEGESDRDERNGRAPRNPL